MKKKHTKPWEAHIIYFKVFYLLNCSFVQRVFHLKIFVIIYFNMWHLTGKRYWSWRINHDIEKRRNSCWL